MLDKKLKQKHLIRQRVMAHLEKQKVSMDVLAFEHLIDDLWRDIPYLIRYEDE